MMSFADLFYEYIYTPPSERTEEEKKQIKYASIRKRDKIRKTDYRNFNKFKDL